MQTIFLAEINEQEAWEEKIRKQKTYKCYRVK